MKTFLRYCLFLIVALLYNQSVFAQAKPFYNRYTFPTVNGQATKFNLYTSLNTKTPDIGGRGRTYFYDGEPTKQTIDKEIFGEADIMVGKFYVTDLSKSTIDFELDYGFNDVRGDERYHFDKVTWAVGDYKTNETPQIALAAQDVTYDCNPITVRNCRVYQRHYISVPRNAVYNNPAKAYTKLLIIRYFKGSTTVPAKTMLLPILVRGKFDKFIVRDNGPHQVKTILRAVPGDNSKAFIEANKEYSTERAISASLKNSTTKETSKKIEASYSKYGISGGASYESSKSTTNTNTNEQTNKTTFTHSNKTRIENGTIFDRYIVEAWEYDYYNKYDIGVAFWAQDRIVVTPEVSLGIVPAKWVQDLNYYENELLETHIPNFKKNKLDGEAKFWEDLISLNAELKGKARKKRNLGNARGVSIENTREESTSVSYKQEISFTKSESKEITASLGVEIGFVKIGGEAKDKTTLTVETTNSTENAQANKKTLAIGFSINDDNDNDFFNIDLYEDDGFGSPVYVYLPDSKTSCPYEDGLKVDLPDIKVKKYEGAEAFGDSAKFSDIPLGKEVIFSLKIKNNSEAKQLRNYRVRFDHPTEQLPKIEFIGLPEFALAFGAERTVDFTVKNVYPTEKGYKEIFLIVEPECSDAESRQDFGYMSDTVKVSAFWGATDLNREPDNNLPTSALLLPTDGKIQTTFTNKFGTLSPISNKNANADIGEEILVPNVDCNTGWCAEENGKPVITNSVWFKFAASTPRIVIKIKNDLNGGFNYQMAAFKVGNVKDFSTFTRLGATDDAAILLENLTLGDSVYVLIDGFKGAQNNFGISVEALKPANDDACKMIDLKVDGALVKNFTNVAATAQVNEEKLIPVSKDPINGWNEDKIQHSVWFRFVAPAGGEVVIDVINATFDAQVAVFDMGRVCDPDFFSQFTHIGANDDITFSGGLDSRLYLKGLKKGQPYGILVDGFNGETGKFDMQLSAPKPNNDEPENAIMLVINAAGQGQFSNDGASATTAEQVLVPPTVELDKPGGWSDVKGDSRARQIEHSVWFKFIAPPEGAVKISTCDQSNLFLQMAVYEVGNIKNYATYKLIAADDNSQICRRPPSNEYPNGTGVRGSILNLTGLKPDSTYYLLIDGQLQSVGQFNIDLLTTPDTTPPENDDVCNAIAIPVDNKLHSGFDNFAATARETEYRATPKEWLDKQMGGTVWFTFIAPNSGEVEISTCNLANFDTQLAVYLINNCKLDSTFVLKGANEDGPRSCSTDGDSFLQIKDLTAGQKYYLVVDGYGRNKGNFSLIIKDKITPGPVNDDVANAISLPVNGVIQKGFTNSLATVRANEQNIRPKPAANQDCTTGWCDNQVDNSVWFKFVAPADGKVNISTCDLADFDTQIALYSATNVADFSTFTLKAANDAGPTDCSTFFDSYLPVTGLTAGQTYYILVDGFDGDNGRFDIRLSGTADTQAPTSPTNLASTDTQSTSASISWTAATDNTGVKEYEVYVDGTSVGKTSETKFTISNLKPTTAYTITVVANDAAGNASAASTAIKVTTTAGADTQAPSSPTALTVTENKSTTVSISWTPATDNVGIKEYTIYLDGALIGTTSDTKFTIPNLTASTAYSVTIVAKDAAGNASPASSALKITTATAGDTQAPSSPTALTITETKSTSVSISWTAATDNVGVNEYAVYVDGALIGTTSETKFTIPNLTPATAYTVSIIAKDAAGNASPASAALKITTIAVVVADTQAPTSPTNLLASVIKTNSVKISWTAATDNVGIKEYKIYLDGTFNASSTATTFDITGLTSATAYSIYITAIDAAGNISPNSSVLKVTTLVDIELSIGPDNIDTYRVYPNPFDNQVSINVPDFDINKGIVEIRNVTGNIISTPAFKIEQNGTLSINTDNLPSGMMTLVVKSNGKSYVKKIVKF